MSLSLEVKKFINSEHTGDYITVVLPSELPVERAQVREVNRDRSLSASARTVADERGRAAIIAAEKAESASALCVDKANAVENLKATVAALTEKRELLRPDMDVKKALFDNALNDYNIKNTEYSKKLEAYLAAEEANRIANSNVSSSVQSMNERKALLDSCEEGLRLAKQDSKQRGDRLSSFQSELAGAKALAERAKEDAEGALKRENECAASHKALTLELAQFTAIQKNDAKRVADCKRVLAAATKELNKLNSELTSANEAVKTAEKLLSSQTSKSDKEILRNKLNALRQKASAALSKRDNSQTFFNKAEQEMQLADSALSETEALYNEAVEKLAASKEELDAATVASRNANEKAVSLNASHISLTTTYETEKAALEGLSADIAQKEQALIAAKTALLNAESESETNKKLASEAVTLLQKAKSVMEERIAIASESKSDMEAARMEYELAEGIFNTADNERLTAQKQLDILITEHEELIKKRDLLIKASEDAKEASFKAEEEAERLRLSIRTIDTQYETAKIHYMQMGKGEDIILIHSIGQSLYTFRDLMTKLSSHFRVTALDLVGCGYSEKPYIFGYTMDDMADFIGRFMDAIGVSTAHFYGFAMGAGYLLHFAKKYADRVDKLIIMSPGGITPDMPLSVRMVESGLFGGLAIRLINFKSVDKMLAECFFDLTNLTDTLVTEYYRPISDPDARRVIRSCVMNFDDESVIHSLRDVQAETLLLWGNEDKWHPTEMSDIFQAAIPNVAYSIVRNAGHLAHEEKADRVAKLIKQFIPCGYDE